MMNNLYKIKGTAIVETPTNQIIRRCKNRKDALNMLASLISGTGFEGNTPRFFCIEVKVS